MLSVQNPTGGTLPIYGAIVATTLPPGMSIAQPTSGALQIMGAAVLGTLDENGIFVPIESSNSGSTIPSTLNLLIGDGGGNAADSGILPSALVKNQGGNIGSTVGVNADMMAQITNTINNVLPGMVDAAIQPAIAAAFNDGSNLNKLMDAAGIVTIGNVITPPGASLQTHNGWIRSVV